MANGRSDGSVIIDTLVDTRGFGKGVNTMKRQMGGLTGAINKLGLAIAATFGISQLVKFGKSAIELGSDLEEVQNVVDVTFTTMNEAVNEFARNAAETAGLSETMAKRYTGTFGAMAKAFGFAEEQSFQMSTALTQLAGDVASFYNITQDEAYTKLKSVFTGETETLKDLGVVMTQNALDSYAMAKGYGKTTKAMSEQEKVALQYSFVLDQLSAAQGDFVRTSDSWANQTRILSLNFDTFKANVGKALINIFTPFLKVLNQLVAKLAQLSQHFVAFSELLVGKSTSGGGGSPGEALEGIEEGYENIADATDKATKSQNKYLTGLDEIRTFAESDALEDSSGLDFSQIEGSSDVVKNEVNDTTDLIANLENRFPKLIKVLKDSFGKIKEIFNDFKVGDFFAAGQDISQLVTGIYNFVSEAIDEVEWEKLGEEIGNFLAGIEWLEIIKGALKLKGNIWKAIAEVWIGMWNTAPFETAFISALAAARFLGLGNVLKNKITNAIPKTLTIGEAIAISVSVALLVKTLTVEGAEDFLGTFNKDIKDWTEDDWINAILRGAGTTARINGEVVAKGTLRKDLMDSMPTPEDFKTIEEYKDALNQYMKENAKTLNEFNLTNQEITEEFDVEKLHEEMDVFGNLKDWWNNDVVPWWENAWSDLLEGMKFAFDQGWKDFVDWWSNTAISKWWDEDVKPWFEEGKWIYLLYGIHLAFDKIFTGIKNLIKDILNQILTFVETMVNSVILAVDVIANALNGINLEIPGVGKISAEIPLIKPVKIPMLATGAVIPPNAPFMAVLGDQRHGTNIEAPLDTIKQAVREVMGSGNGGKWQFTAQINRRTLFDEFIEEAKLRQSTTGRNPLDLT